MADRLEESVAIIRRDRDYSRDFLADVSHELRTPIAAMRTFVELLQGPAGRGPGRARPSSSTRRAVQLDRLDWLAQNLLELSKLDSGLVLLDLRPDDVRGTIESAVEQQLRRRGAQGHRAHDDPAADARSGSATTRRGSARSISNLVGNAVKFTEHGGRSTSSRASCPTAARRSRSSTPAVGIQPDELPLIFDRFYRGSGRQRGARHGLRPRPGDREVDRRHAPRDDRGREPGRASGRGSSCALPRDPREVPEWPPSPTPRTVAADAATGEGGRIFTQRRPGDESRTGTLDGTPRPPRRRHHRAAREKIPAAMNDDPDGGRSPGRRPTRSARRHAARRRPPLRPDPRSATRRPWAWASPGDPAGASRGRIPRRGRRRAGARRRDAAGRPARRRPWGAPPAPAPAPAWAPPAPRPRRRSSRAAAAAPGLGHRRHGLGPVGGARLGRHRARPRPGRRLRPAPPRPRPSAARPRRPAPSSR